jgi:hypothetical protein
VALTGLHPLVFEAGVVACGADATKKLAGVTELVAVLQGLREVVRLFRRHRRLTQQHFCAIEIGAAFLI